PSGHQCTVSIELTGLSRCTPFSWASFLTKRCTSAGAGWRRNGGAMFSDRARHDLERYARATWCSFDALTVASTGLPADSIDGALRGASRAGYTSPTNIGMLIWAVLAARDLELIAPEESVRRIRRVLDSVSRLERHAASGQFYNWYAPETLE